MSIKSLKKLLGISNQVSSDQVAQEIVNLVSKEKIQEVQNLKNDSRIEIIISLLAIYLLIFKIVIRNNDLRISKGKTEEVFRYYSELLVDSVVDFGKMNIKRTKLLQKVKAKADELLEVYQTAETSNNLAKIEEVIEKVNFALTKDMILRNVTLIQDYLVNKARNYAIVN
ncbi:hypothetical protein [Halanaerobaculum tunisiense]